MGEEEIVRLKILDGTKGDVLFEAKVSTDVAPQELLHLGCFRHRGLDGICHKPTKKQMKSFKGLQNNIELVAGRGEHIDFSGVLYVSAADGVVRKSQSVPVCDCVMMSVWRLSHEECEKAFKCETLEELQIYWSKLRQIPKEIGNMKKLKKLILYDLGMLNNIPEDIGELSSLEQLWIAECEIERLPNRLRDLKLKWLSLKYLSLHLSAEDLIMFSKTKQLTIWNCSKIFTPSFWEMVKSSSDIRVLDLVWVMHDREMLSALEENGSIVDGGGAPDKCANFFARNSDNHKRSKGIVIFLLAIRRYRTIFNWIPKDMFQMLSRMLWNTRSDTKAWTKKQK
jgi:hypothetical protein